MIMANFIDTNINQTVFLDINYLDVLGNNTFEYYLYQLLEQKNLLTDFHNRYKNKKVGRKAYPPELLLRIIFYAYYRGVTSSRTIANLCKTDLKFMALAVGKQPHFTTIADFVSSNSESIKVLFHRVLLICNESNLIGKEHFAIDGCKLPTNASKEWSGSHKELKNKSDKMRARAGRIVDKHIDSDSSKNNDSGHHKKELQAVDTLLRNADKIDNFLAENEKRIGQSKQKKEVQSNITDNESCKMTTSKGTIQGMTCVTAADEKHQIIVHAEAFGMGQEQATLKPMIEGIRKNLGGNVLSDGCKVTADTGFSSEVNMKYLYEEGIDAVVPDNQFRQRDPIFSDSETYLKHKEKRKLTRKDKATTRVIFSSDEFAVNFKEKICVCPNGKEMLYTGDNFETASGPHMRFRGMLKDCRECPLQAQCMKHEVKQKGRQVSFLIEDKRKESYLDLMKKKIDSEEGKQLYSRRMWVIEPVFGNICANKRLNRLSLRGTAKVTGQWLMYCMVHNIEKLWKNTETPQWA
jgi:transposase